MIRSLKEKDQVLYTFVDEILFYHWDPVGASDSPEARDEYHDYLPQVFMLVKNGAAVESISKLLAKFQTEDMGMPLDEHKNSYVAKMLLSARTRVNELYQD